jgi:hypothetical protein
VSAVREEYAELRAGNSDDIGLWLAERLASRYAFDSEKTESTGHTTGFRRGVWMWRLSSGRLHRIDTSVVVQAVRCELDHVYYRLLDDTTVTAAAVERLSSDRFIQSSVMPVLRMLLALPTTKPAKPAKPARAASGASGTKSMKRRRRCHECGMVSTPANLGWHQKRSGHTGWTELEPTPEPIDSTEAPS